MKKVIYLMLFVSLSSCEKYLDFEGDDLPSKLVVNSLFTHNEMLEVHVSTSLSQLDEAPLAGKDNAVVKLYDQNNVLIGELLNNNNGYYTSENLVEDIESTYQVEVSAPGFETVNGQSKIPNNSMTFDGGTAAIEINNFEGFEEIRTVLNLDFIEAPTENQYYGLTLELGYVDEFSGDVFYYNTGVELTDPLVNATGNAGNEVLFTDELINGKNSSIEVSTYTYLTDPITNEVLVPDEVRVFVRSYSREAYEYLKSYDLYAESEFDFLATPVQIFTNIENGLGVFGGYNQEIYAFDLN